MEDIITDWSRKEFKAYLLLYAANADFFESKEELEMIRKIASDEAYKAIHREFDEDNDYQSIQKILYNIEKFEYEGDEVNRLIADIQKVFNADGEVDTLEKNMLRALKHLLQ